MGKKFYTRKEILACLKREGVRGIRNLKIECREMEKFLTILRMTRKEA